MTKRTCFSCGVVFDAGFAIYCNVCTQTKTISREMKKQAKLHTQPPPVYYQPQPIYAPVYTRPEPVVWSENTNYVPLTKEQLQKRKEYRLISSFLMLLIILFPFAACAFFWVITSGWLTFFSFLAVPFIVKYLVTKHWHWQVKNAKYLFG